MAVDIGAAFKITASVAGQQAVDNLNKSVSSLQGYAKTAGLALAGLGAGVGVSVLKEKFDGVVDSLIRVKEAAEKTGASGDKIGAIFQAAKITGDEFGEIESAIIKMNKALAGQDDAAKGAAHALEALGLNISNLRKMDPADSFREISLAMAKFEDGAGKTAVAMDIFGKNGAQILPFMKDYAELGDIVAKSTDEQRQMADEYHKSVLRLVGAKNELYRVISMAVLPAANDFVKAMLAVNKETGGVREQVKGLAADGSITNWADMAVKGLTYVIDAGQILIRVFKGVAYTIAAAAAQAGSLFDGAFAAITQLKSGNFGAAWDALKGGVSGANEVGNAWQEDIRAMLTEETLGSKLRSQLDALRAQRGQGEAGKRSDGLKGYQSRDAGPAKVDPYDTEMSSLGRESAKLQWMTEHIEQYEEKITSAREAQARFDTESSKGKFVGESQARKTAMVAEAKAVDEWAEKLRQAKEGLAYEKQTKNVMAETRALTMNAEQKQIALALQDLENRGIKEGSELWDKLAKRRIEAIRAQTAEQNSWLTGLRQGLNEYADNVANFGKGMKDAVTNAFKGMEDALVNFVMTGKLNFHDLASSIIKDLIRIQIQQSITRPLAGMLGSMFGGGQAINPNSGEFMGSLEFDGGGYTGSGARSGGLDGKGGFLAMLHPQETVVDHYRGQGMGGGNSSVVVNVNVEGGGQQVSSTNGAASLGKAIAGAVQAELLRQKRPGGLLAA